MIEEENMTILTVEGGVLEICPECGCTQFFQCEITTQQPFGKREHRKGLKCFECGTIFMAKK